MDGILFCKECGTINEAYSKIQCIKCGACLDEQHCHNRKGECIPFLDDCHEHSRSCIDGCHDDCACQDHGG